MAMLQQAAAASPAPPPEAEAPAAPVEQSGPATDQVTAAVPPAGSDNKATEPTPDNGGAEGEFPAKSGDKASPEEQAEYERAIKALETVMYGNDQTSRAIVDQIQPENKIDSVVKASMLMLKQLDEKLNFDKAIIPQLVLEITDRLVEMGERVKQIKFTDKDLHAIVGATWEGVMQIYGVDQESYDEMISRQSPDTVKNAESQYKNFLGNAGEATPGAEGAAPASAPAPAPAAAGAG